MNDISNKIGDFWSKKTSDQKKSPSKLKLRWWQSQLVIRHINKIVCGEEVTGRGQGLIQHVRDCTETLIPFEKGISVGGGNGVKEMALLRQEIVKTFELYDFSEARIVEGKKLAKQKSLENRIHFINGDAFDLVTQEESYDFVHWSGSLHHMLDVDEAVKWSKKILKKGGLFFMDEYIGAARFQWSDEQLKIASRIRKIFKGSDYLINPKDNNRFLSATRTRPNREALIERDPSEAADSDRIVSSILRYFPNAEVKNTGGIVYNLVLQDMLSNFDEENERDRILLDLLMFIDEQCIGLGHSLQGVAIAFKES